ncbi:MAG: C4-dicarboxylate ABC transporter permease [Pseudooceanicola sp.]|jgi:TRAP-type C4-dicarboxylate transport system permease small subunit|nr:C4-dicarboxylate ABC transporter permease [Pseudooceanicola sp.]|tara:strand:- start:572 stop:1066 length:495 start_codon:yes stop_codon:yes gene_type:complete
MPDRIFDTVLLACAWLSGLIFGASALAISANVVLRNAFGTPIYGLLDAVQYGLLVATFLGAPWVLSIASHVSVDLLTSHLPPRIAGPLARVIALFGAGVSGAVCWFSLQATLASYAKGSMIRTAFTIPEWLTLVLMPVAFGLLTLEFLRQTARPPRRTQAATGL